MSAFIDFQASGGGPRGTLNCLARPLLPLHRPDHSSCDFPESVQGQEQVFAATLVAIGVFRSLVQKRKKNKKKLLR